MVYPSATGSRFEHGLGAMHLAMRGWTAAWGNAPRTDADRDPADRLDPADDGVGSALDDDREPDQLDVRAVFEDRMAADLGISNRRVAAFARLAVGGAGLLHDVGHPPFSHILEPLYEALLPEYLGA